MDISQYDFLQKHTYNYALNMCLCLKKSTTISLNLAKYREIVIDNFQQTTLKIDSAVIF